MSTPTAQRHYWIFTADPHHYHWDTLFVKGKEMWHGAASKPDAIRALKQVRKGDRVLCYHSAPERTSVLGLARNPAFLTATLGMAMMTFSMGGIQAWMPQFLYSERHYSLESANLLFGIIIVVDGIFASLIGGWLGDYLLPKMKSAYYLVSAIGMALGIPFMIVGLFVIGRMFRMRRRQAWRRQSRAGKRWADSRAGNAADRP